MLRSCPNRLEFKNECYSDTGSLGGKGFECVARDDVWSEPGSGCRGEGELEVGDLTLIGKGVGNP